MPFPSLARSTGLMLGAVAVVAAVAAGREGRAATDAPRPLSEIRKDIDATDRGLLDLLNRRAAISLEVAAAKRGGAGPVFRPGRQAALMRRLAEGNEGALPDADAWRVWQEIVGASIRLQTGFAVAYAAPDAAVGGVGYALATGYFGSGMALRPVGSAASVADAVRRGAADVGVLPLSGAGAWWRTLTAAADGAGSLRTDGAGPLQADGAVPLQVVARLPFVPPAPGHPDTGGFIVAPYAADPSGADRDLLAIETAPGVPAAAVLERLGQMGWAGATVLAEERSGESWGWLADAEVRPSPAPPGPAEEIGADGGLRVRVVGRYAVPLGSP